MHLLNKNIIRYVRYGIANFGNMAQKRKRRKKKQTKQISIRNESKNTYIHIHTHRIHKQMNITCDNIKNIETLCFKCMFQQKKTKKKKTCHTIQTIPYYNNKTKQNNTMLYSSQIRFFFCTFFLHIFMSRTQTKTVNNKT